MPALIIANDICAIYKLPISNHGPIIKLEGAWHPIRPYGEAIY